jgi:hypothetical protein
LAAGIACIDARRFPTRQGWLITSVEEAASGAASHHKSPQLPQLELVLKHAQHLLNYAVEAGIELDADIAQRIIAAKRLGPAIWSFEPRRFRDRGARA